MGSAGRVFELGLFMFNFVLKIIFSVNMVLTILKCINVKSICKTVTFRNHRRHRRGQYSLEGILLMFIKMLFFFFFLLILGISGFVEHDWKNCCNMIMLFVFF
ncbi:hypothetical protein VNO78_27418 [Psophocarpus tetragonolobus]|uniref:Uncharacterized protein n=1 Tax=Psophocarpus tetragonolobus TaxID=3891 RepID=A0AAN9S1I5_PSOTE